jgi:competence ComEA-like helix-hairpin-helix protein
VSPSERRIIIALLGLAVLGQGVRLALNQAEPPGEAFLLPAAKSRTLAAHRDTSADAGRELRKGETIDPDRATARELDRLPGVGMRLAKEIVSDRELRGPFGSAEGLLRVDGIGPAAVRRLEPFLRFQAPRLAPPAIRETPNLNTMTLTDLERLPGVGPSLARAILAYRDKNGPFADPRELDRVPGVGPKLTRRLMDLVAVR